MAATTSSTIDGLMAKIVADTTSVFRTQSALFDAVYNVEALNSTVVQFQSESVPAAISGQTEGAQLSATTITISAVNATLESYPVLARVSNYSLAGGMDVNMKVAGQIAGALARTVDTKIASLFSSFTGGSVGSAGAAISLDSLIKAIGTLQATGYNGTPVAVLHPRHFSDIASDLINVNGRVKDELDSRGFIGTYFGVDMYVSPFVAVDGSDDATSGVFFKEAAIGFGYRNPLISVTAQPNLEYAALDVLGEAYLKAVLLNAGAGVKLIGDVA